MNVFPASSECSSADKSEMTAQCPLHDTIHREKGQRKRALEKSSLSEEVSYVPQKELWKELKDLPSLKNFQWKQKTLRKLCMDSNVTETKKASSY